MMIPFFELRRQYLNIHKDIDRAIRRVLERGWYILGGELEAFEQAFASYCNTKYAIGVGSGTDAIRFGLIACGIKSGDEVITVPNIAAPTVAAIISVNARPVFIDVDPETYTMDTKRLETYLKTNSHFMKAKAVVPVHLYGSPANMHKIMELAGQYRLKVIEDACQAHGAEYNGIKVGTLGDAGCFSFYPTKNLGAYGDGGMVVVNEESLANHIRMLRNYGEEKKYQNVIHGYNSRLDEIQAAILLVKLAYLDDWNSRRRSIAEHYNESLSGEDLMLPVEAPDTKHVYHLYVVRSKKRYQLIQTLQENGIFTSIHYPTPIHYQRAYQQLGYSRGDFPVTERLATEVLSLPMYPELDDESIEYICQVIKKAE